MCIMTIYADDETSIDLGALTEVTESYSDDSANKSSTLLQSAQ